MIDIPITGSLKAEPVPLRTLATVTRTTVPTEITHNNIQPSIDLTMGVEGRDLGHVADDIAWPSTIRPEAARGRLGPLRPASSGSKGRKTLEGSMILLSGEYARMRRPSAAWGSA